MFFKLYASFNQNSSDEHKLTKSRNSKVYGFDSVIITSLLPCASEIRFHILLIYSEHCAAEKYRNKWSKYYFHNRLETIVILLKSDDLLNVQIFGEFSGQSDFKMNIPAFETSLRRWPRYYRGQYHYFRNLQSADSFDCRRTYSWVSTVTLVAPVWSHVFRVTHSSHSSLSELIRF